MKPPAELAKVSATASTGNPARYSTDCSIARNKRRCRSCSDSIPGRLRLDCESKRVSAKCSTKDRMLLFCSPQ